MKIRGRLWTGFAACGCLAVAALATGCAGYSSYPRLEGSTVLSDPNTMNMQDSMIVALTHVLGRRPITKPFALNLPEGMLPERQEVVVRRIQNENARLLTRQTADLPMVHVPRVWIRETRAQVDVVRPVEGLTNADGTQAYEAFTVSLVGGLRPWRVTDVRRWSMAMVTPPPARFADGWGAERPQEASPAVAETGDEG